MDRKRLRALGVIVGLALLGTAWVFATALPERRLNGPMVQMLEPGGFTVVWQGGCSGPAQLEIRQEDGEWQAIVAVSPEDGRYEAKIVGLEPATVYRYEIQSEGEVAVAGGRARTAPGVDGSFRFLAFGDSGTGKENQYALALQMPEFEPDIVLHTGDLGLVNE